MRQVFALVCVFGLFAGGNNGQCAEENTSPSNGVISFCNDPNCAGCRAFLAGYTNAPSCSCATDGAGDGTGGYDGGTAEDYGLGENLLAGDYGGGYGYETAAPNMIGDSLIGGGMLTHQGADPEEASAASLFSFHTFKVAEDDSPWPKNRLYFNTNDYNNVPGTDTITRFMLGFERTFWDGQASLGMRLPIWNADIENFPTGGGPIPFASAGENTALGDLTITMKAKLAERETGVLTSGLSVTMPTGPDTLANVDPFYSINNVSHLGTVQPWLGWYRARESLNYGLFTQVFLAFDLAVDQDDADYLYLDLGAGYRMPRDGFITAITPMFEAHWSSPIADASQTLSLTPLGMTLPGLAQDTLRQGVLGYRNQVNLTSAVNLELQNSQTLVIGVAIPTVGPNVMDMEFICQYNAFIY